MQQVIHLLIVDRDRRTSLATLFGSRWLLPIVCCPERTRPAPLVARWLAERGIAGTIVGQWLGRLTATNGEMDWLVIVDAHATRALELEPAIQRVPLEQLGSSTAVLDYQRWAVQRAIPRDEPTMDGPFGSMTWFDDLRAWLEALVGPLSGPPFFYTVTPHEVVLRIATGHGLLYFKGLTEERAAEARITSMLSARFPESFARTIALETRADASVWWLAAHCDGTTLAADLSLPRTRLVAAHLARIQQQVIGTDADLALPDAELATAATWAHSLLGEHAASEAAVRAGAAIEMAQRVLGIADLPRSWIPLDLDGGNVLIDREAVRFIDLDDSRIGAAPLALSTLLRRSIRGHPPADRRLWRATIRRAYEESWDLHLDRERVWPHVEAASILIDAYLSWQRLVRRSRWGELDIPMDHVASRTAQRLARMLGSSRHADVAHWSR